MGNRKSAMTYIELHARSAFSFLEGASVPEELIAATLALEMPAMALLDRDGFYGSPRFHLSAKKNGIKAHIGAEITVQSPKSNVQSQKQDEVADIGLWTLDFGQTHSSRQNETFSLPILVRNRAGYQNLCRLITLMKLRVPKHAKPGECSVTPDELAEYAEGLVCLTGGHDGPLAKAFNHRDT
jgi:error-prone DNA polymerase